MTCRCGYASPPTLSRCLGCGRRFGSGRCERAPVASRSAAPLPRRPAPAVVRPPAPRPVVVEPPPFSGRDAHRFGAGPAPEPSLALPTGPLVVLGLVAAAWIGPDGPRPEVLTAAALLGAGLAAVRPAATAAPSTPPPTLVVPSRLTDDELREAITAW